MKKEEFSELALSLLGEGEGRKWIELYEEHDEKTRDRMRDHRRNYFRRLKEAHPDRYRENVRKGNERWKRHVAEIRQTDPDSYEKLKERQNGHRRERMERMKREDPVKYEEFKRKARERYRKRVLTAPAIPSGSPRSRGR